MIKVYFFNNTILVLLEQLAANMMLCWLHCSVKHVSFVLPSKKKMIPLRKPMFFCMLYFENKAKSGKEKDRTLFNTPIKQTSRQNLELFWQRLILAKNL